MSARLPKQPEAPPSHFHVGQRVVCISKRVWHAGMVGARPARGGVYTVREVLNRMEGPGLLLREIVNNPAEFVDGYMEPGFAARHFRPVARPRQSLESDIGLFTHHLNKVEERV